MGIIATTRGMSEVTCGGARDGQFQAVPLLLIPFIFRLLRTTGMEACGHALPSTEIFIADPFVAGTPVLGPRETPVHERSIVSAFGEHRVKSKCSQEDETL